MLADKLTITPVEFANDLEDMSLNALQRTRAFRHFHHKTKHLDVYLSFDSQFNLSEGRSVELKLHKADDKQFYKG